MPDNEMNGGSSASYLARTPCVPLFCALVSKGGSRRAFRLPGEGGDHFHCAVEPSPGHIRCRGYSKAFLNPPKLCKCEYPSLLVGSFKKCAQDFCDSTVSVHSHRG